MVFSVALTSTDDALVDNVTATVCESSPFPPSDFLRTHPSSLSHSLSDTVLICQESGSHFRRDERERPPAPITPTEG